MNPRRPQHGDEEMRCHENSVSMWDRIFSFKSCCCPPTVAIREFGVELPDIVQSENPIVPTESTVQDTTWTKLAERGPSSCSPKHAKKAQVHDSLRYRLERIVAKEKSGEGVDATGFVEQVPPALQLPLGCTAVPPSLTVNVPDEPCHSKYHLRMIKEDGSMITAPIGEHVQGEPILETPAAVERNGRSMELRPEVAMVVPLSLAALAARSGTQIASADNDANAVCYQHLPSVGSWQRRRCPLRLFSNSGEEAALTRKGPEEEEAERETVDAARREAQEVAVMMEELEARRRSVADDTEQEAQRVMTRLAEEAGRQAIEEGDASPDGVADLGVANGMPSTLGRSPSSMEDAVDLGDSIKGTIGVRLQAYSKACQGQPGTDTAAVVSMAPPGAVESDMDLRGCGAATGSAVRSRVLSYEAACGSDKTTPGASRKSLSSECSASDDSPPRSRPGKCISPDGKRARWTVLPRRTLANVSEHHVLKAGIVRMHEELTMKREVNINDLPTHGSGKIVGAAFLAQLLADKLELKSAMEGDACAAQSDIRLLAVEQLLRIRVHTLDLATESSSHSARNSFLQTVDKHLFHKIALRCLSDHAGTPGSLESLHALGLRIVLILGACVLLEGDANGRPAQEPLAGQVSTQPLPSRWVLDLADGEWPGDCRAALFHAHELRVDVLPGMCPDFVGPSVGARLAVVRDRSQGVGATRMLHWEIVEVDPCQQDVLAELSGAEFAPRRGVTSELAAILAKRSASTLGTGTTVMTSVGCDV
mmetsp:Transcript_97364/g.275208  ORF Transcript_97364/g.275208 Transcript_97364/m.275208 type:complete len:765 (-) Transcript_97364:87-2381(-)